MQENPNLGKNNEKGLPRSHIFTLYNMRFCYINFAVDMCAGLRPAKAKAGLWPASARAGLRPEFFGSTTKGGGIFYSKFPNYLQKQYNFKTPEIMIRIK